MNVEVHLEEKSLRFIVEFRNNYGLSIVFHKHSFTKKECLFSLNVIKNKHFYNTPIIDPDKLYTVPEDMRIARLVQSFPTAQKKIRKIELVIQQLRAEIEKEKKKGNDVSHLKRKITDAQKHFKAGW